MPKKSSHGERRTNGSVAWPHQLLGLPTRATPTWFQGPASAFRGLDSHNPLHGGSFLSFFLKFFQKFSPFSCCPKGKQISFQLLFIACVIGYLFPSTKVICVHHGKF